MCPNKDMAKEDHGDMDFDLYKKIIDEAADFAFDINLAHRGESLLHPRIVEAIAFAKEKGLFTRLHTNGSLLTEDLAAKIIDAGLNRISFSFDGFDKDTYEHTRIGVHFEKTLQNIIRFLEIKRDKHSKTPDTSIEVINFDGDKKEAVQKEFEARFEGLPLDSFVIKEPHNWAGETGMEQASDHYSVCPFPWNALVIFWNGDVLPCSQDFFGKHVLGNANTDSLRDIWNGQRQIGLRKKLSKKDVKGLPACSKCDRLHRKSFLGVPREFLWKFIAKRMP